MTRRDLLILFLIGLAVPLGIAQFQSLPGYMDADYYFGGGIQLAKGNGFTEPYIWNYLDDPQSLPHPSHAYWMPLASIVAAFGMFLTGQTTFAAARIGFILLAALVPPLTATLAFRVTSNRTLSLLSGLLACFPIYYAPFLPVTDNYAIYMLLGASFFFVFPSPVIGRGVRGEGAFFFLGLLSALMTLARSDGLLWLGISFLVAIWSLRKQEDTYTRTQVDRYTGKQVHTEHAPRNTRHSSFIPSTLLRAGFHLSSFFLILLGFFLLMSPWYARNLSTFGSLMAPGGSRALWLTNYNDTFAYPASQLTMQRWLASGWDAILQTRVAALKLNLLNAFAAQGGVFLFPFILVGLWQLRRDARVRFAFLAWTLLFLVMTLVFPFAGARGAFFHAGAALQPMWWVAAPIGLEAAVRFARERGRFDDRAFVVFRGALVVIAVLMTAVIFALRVLPGWEREDGIYSGVNDLLAQAGAPADAVVLVRNPPGFYLVTGHPAIAIPIGGQESLLRAAERFNARYLVLEPTRVTGNPYAFQLDQPSFRYLGESDGNYLYEILR